tara:strand:- start:356 stop:790 length:435 start_codon:yes stop_codon:yes gene_type:complete
MKKKKTKADIYNEEVDKQRSEISKNLNEKNYLITAYKTGDRVFSGGDWNRMTHPKRYYAVASLDEIPDYINKMKQPFWEHPSLTEETENNEKFLETIPFEEKKWGILRDIVIEPMSEELEKLYLDGSKKGFFKSFRRMSARGEI